MSEEIHRALGRIEGQLQGINERLDTHGQQLTTIDTRLGTVEKDAAREGGKRGVLAAVGVAIMVESVRAWARGHSGAG
jgi:prefoldin subunit 5